MTKQTVSRRIFLVAGASVATVGAFLTRGKWWPSSTTEVPKSPEALTLALALPRLLRVLGPWSQEDRAVADELISRYLSEARMTGYADHREAIIEVAARFSDTDAAVDGVDMSDYSEPARALVESLSRELYGADEVRAYMRNYPPAGSCVGDLNRHTLKPS